MMRESATPWPLSIDDFRRLVDAQKPVAFRGAAADWPCTRNWSNAYLLDKIGARTVTVTRSQQGLFKVDPDKGHYAADDMQSMPFAEFLEHACHPVDQDWRYYLHKHSLDQHLPELLADIQTPEHIAHSAMLLKSLWMGASGSITPIHHDFSDNFFVQVRGRKRLVLYAPEPEEAFYRLPFRTYNGRSSWHVSRIGTLDNVDRVAFPEFARAAPIEVTAEPGDVVYIPTFYWHEVHSLDSPSMSLSYWWADESLKKTEEMIQAITTFVEFCNTAPPRWQTLVQRLLSGAIAKDGGGAKSAPLP